MAPNLDLSFVPSSLTKKSSISSCFVESLPINLGAIISLIFWIAFFTFMALASILPFEAPDGTPALTEKPPPLTKTSIVGFPRESKISLAFIDLIVEAILIFK